MEKREGFWDVLSSFPFNWQVYLTIPLLLFLSSIPIAPLSSHFFSFFLTSKFMRKFTAVHLIPSHLLVSSYWSCGPLDTWLWSHHWWTSHDCLQVVSVLRLMDILQRLFCCIWLCFYSQILRLYLYLIPDHLSLQLLLPPLWFFHLCSQPPVDTSPPLSI